MPAEPGRDGPAAPAVPGRDADADAGRAESRTAAAAAPPADAGLHGRADPGRDDGWAWPAAAAGHVASRSRGGGLAAGGVFGAEPDGAGQSPAAGSRAAAATAGELTGCVGAGTSWGPIQAERLCSLSIKAAGMAE